MLSSIRCMTEGERMVRASQADDHGLRRPGPAAVVVMCVLAALAACTPSAAPGPAGAPPQPPNTGGSSASGSAVAAGAPTPVVAGPLARVRYGMPASSIQYF